MTLSLLAILLLAGCNNNNNPVKNEQGKGLGNGEPPTEMTSACEGKSEGDSCKIAMPSRNNDDSDKTLSGTCQMANNGENLVCKPENSPGDGNERPGESGEGRPNGPGPMQPKEEN